jgi:hypothetical protein
MFKYSLDTENAATTTDSTSTNQPAMINEHVMNDGEEDDDDGTSTSASTSRESKQGEGGKLRSGMESFKVLTECPLIVMLLFQVRRKRKRKTCICLFVVCTEVHVICFSIVYTGTPQVFYVCIFSLIDVYIYIS